MPYRLRADEPMDREITRIVGEQIDKAIAEATSDDLERQEVVHQVRKRCKKIRGVLRLVRDTLGGSTTYGNENAKFRQAARSLSGVRDGQAMVEAHQALVDAFEEPLRTDAFAAIGEGLILRRTCLASELDPDTRLQEFVVTMREAREQLAGWSLSERGFGAIAGGLQTTYRRGCKALAAAYREPTPENFHEWRKRVKYHRYHTRLLRSLCNATMHARWKEVKHLSDLLGDDHDLAVLRRVVLDDCERFGGADTDAFVALIDRRRCELEGAARPLGSRVFAEKPRHLRRRLRRYRDADRE